MNDKHYCLLTAMKEKEGAIVENCIDDMRRKESYYSKYTSNRDWTCGTQRELYYPFVHDKFQP